MLGITSPKALLQSRVARRVLVAFVLSAILPVLVFALLTLREVSAQRERRAARELEQLAKSSGLVLFERLSSLAGDLRMTGARMQAAGWEPGRPFESTAGFAERFAALGLVTGEGDLQPLSGTIQRWSGLTRAEAEHGANGRAILTAVPRAEGAGARLLLTVLRDAEHPEAGWLTAEPAETYLWAGLAEDSPSDAVDTLAMDPSGRILFSTLPPSSPLAGQIALEARSSSRGRFHWADGGREHIAAYWELPLGFHFGLSSLTVVESRDREYGLGPQARFRQTFLAVIVATLGIVSLVSIGIIRRSLEPIARLQEGTRHIAVGDLAARVEIESRDEFESLAASFNAMAEQLERQFATLSTMNEVVRAILAARDASAVVSSVLHRLPELVPCDVAALALLGSGDLTRGRLHVRIVEPEPLAWVDSVDVVLGDLDALRTGEPVQRMGAAEARPSYLAPLEGVRLQRLLLMPLRIKKDLFGVLVLGSSAAEPPPQRDIAEVRLLADQVAVALSNARLLQELSRLHGGALKALARAIDAISHWTMGHSERVATLAVQLARQLGLSGQDLRKLEHGSLLHDIGKVSVPPTILDKRGPLTPDERRILQGHVVTGARILEPIPGFEDLLPLVLEHHEWYDGSGYPKGLKGEDIALQARILAVADSYDAMRSDRPYRRHLEQEEAIDQLVERAGTQFDPAVVAALVDLARAGALKEVAEPSFEATSERIV